MSTIESKVPSKVNNKQKERWLGGGGHFISTCCVQRLKANISDEKNRPRTVVPPLNRLLRAALPPQYS